jgi:5'-3' exonuclease
MTVFDPKADTFRSCHEKDQADNRPSRMERQTKKFFAAVDAMLRGDPEAKRRLPAVLANMKKAFKRFQEEAAKYSREHKIRT